MRKFLCWMGLHRWKLQRMRWSYGYALWDECVCGAKRNVQELEP